MTYIVSISRNFGGGLLLFFFFQAEDGIRDIGVTGVQTCALPISSRLTSRSLALRASGLSTRTGPTSIDSRLGACSSLMNAWPPAALLWTRRAGRDRKSVV